LEFNFMTISSMIVCRQNDTVSRPWSIDHRTAPRTKSGHPFHRGGFCGGRNRSDV